MYSLYFQVSNRQLILRWSEYYSERQHKIKVSPFIARVIKSSNVKTGYGFNVLKKLLNYPTSRVILEYGENIPMRITLENNYGRNTRVWLAPRIEEE